VISCYSGVNPTTPVDPGAPAGSAAIANGTTVTAPSITTVSSGDLVLGAFTAEESTTGEGVIINLPPSLTPRSGFTDSSAGYLASAVGDLFQSSAGATGDLTITTANGNLGDALIAQQVALQPLSSSAAAVATPGAPGSSLARAAASAERPEEVVRSGIAKSFEGLPSDLRHGVRSGQRALVSTAQAPAGYIQRSLHDLLQRYAGPARGPLPAA
jgi:hypothetical protein